MSEVWILANQLGYDEPENEGVFDNLEAAKKHAESVDSDLGLDEFEWTEDLGVWYGVPYRDSPRQWIIRHVVVRDGGGAVNELAAAEVKARRDRLWAERVAAVAMLRIECAAYDDNDWPGTLHLADVIEKHLARSAYEAVREAQARASRFEAALRRLAEPGGWQTPEVTVAVAREALSPGRHRTGGEP